MWRRGVGSLSLVSASGRSASLVSSRFLLARLPASARRLCATDQKDADEEKAKQEGAPKEILEQRIRDNHRLSQNDLKNGLWVRTEDRTSIVLELAKELKQHSDAQEEIVSDAFLGRAHASLGFVQLMQHKYTAAEENLKKGIELLKTALGASHQEVGHALLTLTELLSRPERVAEAEAPCREAIKILEENSADPHVIGAAYSNLAGILWAQDKLQEAAEPSMRALDILEKHLGLDNEVTLSAMANALRIWDWLGSAEEVAKIKERYKNRHKEYLALHEQGGNEDMSAELPALLEDWQAESPKLRFDPPGMYKPRSFHMKEIRAFIKAWVNHTGHKTLSADEVWRLVQEVDGWDDKELRTKIQKEPDAVREVLDQLRQAAGSHWPQQVDPVALVQRAKEEKAAGGVQTQLEEEFAFDLEREVKKEVPQRGKWKRLAEEAAEREAAKGAVAEEQQK